MDPRPARVAGGRRSGVDAAPVAPEQPGSGQAEGGPEQRIADQRGDHETLGQGFRRQAGMDLGLRRAEQVRQRQQDGATSFSGQLPPNTSRARPTAVAAAVAIHQYWRCTRSAAAVPGSSGGRPSDGARQNTA